MYEDTYTYAKQNRYLNSNQIILAGNDSDKKHTIQASDSDMKTIFIITPTYQRRSQKVDLISMCHTLMHVPRIVWVVIEDAPKVTSLVTNVLQHCKVETVHLTAQTSAKYIPPKGATRITTPRGVDQRNAGLRWLRHHYCDTHCSGVVYFGDDDNKYDLRLFDDVSISSYVRTPIHFGPVYSPLDSQDRAGFCMEGGVVGSHAVGRPHLPKWKCHIMACTIWSREVNMQ